MYRDRHTYLDIDKDRDKDIDKGIKINLNLRTPQKSSLVKGGLSGPFNRVHSCTWEGGEGREGVSERNEGEGKKSYQYINNTILKNIDCP